MSVLEGTHPFPGLPRRHKIALYGLPCIAIVLMVVIFVVLEGINTDQHQANLDSCARGNESRLSTVNNLRGDRINLEADREFLRDVIAPSDGREALVKQKTEAITWKAEAIQQLIESQAAVAIRPGSPVVDCDKAFP